MQLPRRLLGLALLLALLLQTVATQPPARIAPADAALHEGSRVTVAGAVRDVWVGATTTRVLLVHDGHGVHVTTREPFAHGLGTWLEATGRLARIDGRLLLLAESFAVGDAPDPAEPAWEQVATDPAGWSDHVVRLRGSIHDGVLRARDIHVALGEGDWPASGSVEADGVLAYDAACLCFRMHATRVAPWTA